MDALALIRRRVEQCEAEGISLLCCPEAILGALADNSPDPRRFAVASDRIASVLTSLASRTVTTIVGLTELGDDGALYNSAAVLHRRVLVGVYRKQHPAIRRSVYAAGTETPVFRVDDLTFGIVICYDSTFPELAARIGRLGATVLFVPSNNALPRSRNCEGLVEEARQCDTARATESGLWIVRADVAGEAGGLASAGSSAIVRPDGTLVCCGRRFAEDLLVADLHSIAPRSRKKAIVRPSEYDSC